MVLVLVLMGSRGGWRRLGGVDVFSSRAQIVSFLPLTQCCLGPTVPRGHILMCVFASPLLHFGSHRRHPEIRVASRL